MTRIIAYLYMSGPGQVLKDFSLGIDSLVFELRKAEKAREDIWYIEFPTYSFTLLSLGAELLEYVNKYEEILSIARPAKINFCILTLGRQSTSGTDHVGFYLEPELIQKMGQLAISLNFDPDFIIRDVVPRWSL